MQYSYSTHELAEQDDVFWFILEKLPIALSLVFISLTFVYWFVEIYSLIYEKSVEVGFLRRMAEKTKPTTDSQSIHGSDQIYNDLSYVHHPGSQQLSGTNYCHDLFNHSSSNFREQSSKRVGDWTSTYCGPMSSSYGDKVRDSTTVLISPELQSGLSSDQTNEVCIDIDDFGRSIFCVNGRGYDEDRSLFHITLH